MAKGEANLVIMAKAPALGQVKRRLASDVGDVRATYFYRMLLKHIIERVSGSPRWTTCLAITPDHASARFAAMWSGAVIPQGDGNLGTRMERIFRRRPHDPTLIIGSDIPGVTEMRVSEAFAALRDRHAVFGPAEDGGYWLVGLSRGSLARGMFAGVRWSSDFALADTLRNFSGLEVAMTARLGDVDDRASYVQLASLGARLTPPAQKPTNHAASRQPVK